MIARTPPPLLAGRLHTCISRYSDIHEHLGTLWGLARASEHTTEMGIRYGNSTTAILAAQPAVFHAYDIMRTEAVDELLTMCGRTAFHFHEEDSLYATIEETDFLHIDTIHCYTQLSKELARHASKVRCWIAMHDTETFGGRGDNGDEGMWKAIEELLAGGQWRVWGKWANNNGLTVLERVQGC